jgi:hypothetical protein
MQRILRNASRVHISHSTIRRHASLLADGHGQCDKVLSSGMKIVFENPNSSLPYNQISKHSLKNYQFPEIVCKFNQEDIKDYNEGLGFPSGR